MPRNGYTSTMTTSPEKVGDYATVDNVSGEPSRCTEPQPRDSSAVTAQPPGGPTGHRTPVVIDATSGQRLGDFTEQSAANFARHLSITETVDAAAAHPREQEYLDHIFGRNLPGRRGAGQV